jgi:quercetin dioxygenase-like cupin family protein
MSKEMNPSEVYSLGAMIQVQEGAVVSRTLVNQKTGTVTLFGFDKGQGLSEHTAPYDAMAYLLEGEMVITIAGKPFTLKGGDVLLMPADQPHALDTVQSARMLLVMIRS